jgi:hypothetical protein
LRARLRAAPRWLRRAGTLFLALWAAALFGVVGLLMLGHHYDLPRPASTDAVTVAALNALRAPDELNRVLAVHVLYSECRCSKRVLAHLLEGARPADVAEKILLVGNGEIDVGRVQRAGFDLERISRSELERRFHIVGVPLLAIAARDGTVEYLGGYTDQKQGPVIRDRELIANTSAGRSQPALPLLGCALARGLRRRVDPLGLKGRDDES